MAQSLPALKPSALLALLATCIVTGDESGDYQARQQHMLAQLPAFADPAPIDSEAEYTAARAIKTALCSLSCHTFNPRHASNDRVWEIEAQWGRRLAQWNRRYLRTDPVDRLVARALLTHKRRSDIALERLFTQARDRELLARTENGGVVVVGLGRKVGDNTFTMDRHNRPHRKYTSTIGRQAIHVDWELPWAADQNRAFVASLPLIDAQYQLCAMGDYKGAVQASHMRRGDWARLKDMLEPVAASRPAVRTEQAAANA